MVTSTFQDILSDNFPQQKEKNKVILWHDVTKSNFWSVSYLSVTYILSGQGKPTAHISANVNGLSTTTPAPACWL